MTYKQLCWSRQYFVFAITWKWNTASSFLTYFSQNIWAANLQHKLTNAKQSVSPDFQEFRIIPENNFPKLVRMAMHIRHGHSIAFQLDVLEFSSCGNFVVEIQHASLPCTLTTFCCKTLRFLAIIRRLVL